MFGSERNGFSPMQYIPLIVPSSAPFVISVTVSPARGSSGTPHACSKRPRISGSVTRW
jgi:hypothetical protein